MYNEIHVLQPHCLVPINMLIFIKLFGTKLYIYIYYTIGCVDVEMTPLHSISVQGCINIL